MGPQTITLFDIAVFDAVSLAIVVAEFTAIGR